MVDASLGFIYQAKVPLFPKPGKHEQCEVTEWEWDRETNTSAKAQLRVSKKRNGEDRRWGSDRSCWSFFYLYTQGAKVTLYMQHPASLLSFLPTREGVRYYICLSWSRFGLLCQQHPVTDPACQEAPRTRNSVEMEWNRQAGGEH